MAQTRESDAFDDLSSSVANCDGLARSAFGSRRETAIPPRARTDSLSGELKVNLILLGE